MANKIIVKKSSVANKVPVAGDLDVGELAVNVTDQKIYTKNASGAIVELGGGASSGNVVGPSSATDNALVRFDGTTGKLIQNGTITQDDSGNLAGIVSEQYNTAATPPTIIEGLEAWDSGNGTLEVGLKGGNVSYKYGQQEFVRAYNGSGSAMTKGQVVYIVGAQGNRVDVRLAKADAESTSAGTIGFVAESIANGAEGWVQVSGTLPKLDTSTFTAGVPIYLSAATAGAYTTTRPTAPNHTVILGWVERVSATVGSFYVKVDNGYELDELHNVLITSAASGNTLIYDAVAGVWENANLTAGTGISVTNGAGSITIANTGVTSVATGTGLTGGTITTTGTISLANTAVTAGTYTNATVTVDAQGRITSASSGSGGGVTSFNTRTGAVTLSSGDVTGALGYTPYNSTNPSGYITSSGSISGSAGSVPASGITGQSGMWTSSARPGPYRLYRNDDNSAYNVQTTWSANRSGYWSLRGYNGDTYHAGCWVNWAGEASTAYYLSGTWDSSGRNYNREWIEMPNYTGLYSPNNGAHFYPNNASYGSWRIAGSRNGWGGIEFDRAHQVCLMVNHNESGFYNTSYGWQIEWYNGTLYVGKGSYGGSTATVWDSSNMPITSYGSVGSVCMAESTSLRGAGSSWGAGTTVAGSSLVYCDVSQDLYAATMGGLYVWNSYWQSSARSNNFTASSMGLGGTWRVMHPVRMGTGSGWSSSGVTALFVRIS